MFCKESHHFSQTTATNHPTLLSLFLHNVLNFPYFRRSLLIIRLDLNFKMHQIRSQLLNTYFGPHRAMIWHPFSEVLNYTVMLRSYISAICDNTINLRPAFTAGMPQVIVDILEGLVDLFQQIILDKGFEVDFLLLALPTAWEKN